jgi:uncharacterized protein (DUF849 family)
MAHGFIWRSMKLLPDMLDPRATRRMDGEAHRRIALAIGGGMDTPNVYNLTNFLRPIPDGSMLTVESSMLNTLPINMMGIALGPHVRCGIEDNLWNQKRTGKMTSVQQIEQLVRISREFGRDIATAKEACEILRIGVFYDTVEETLAANGFAVNPKGRQQGYLRKVA